MKHRNNIIRYLFFFILISANGIVSGQKAKKPSPAKKALTQKEIIAKKVKDLYSEDYLKTFEASQALVKIGAPAVDTLVVLLNDSNSEVRCKAAEALGNIKDKRAVAPLIELLDVTDANIRMNAATALGTINDTSAVEPLIKSLNDENIIVRNCTANSLGMIKDPRALEPLFNCFKNGNADTRRNAIEALTNISKPSPGKMLEVLISILPAWDLMELQEYFPPYPKEKFDSLDINKQIYVKVFYKDKKFLNNNWNKVKSVLLDDVKSDERSKIEFAVFSFIAIGKKEIVKDLKALLDEYGSVQIAETFLNCGNSDLYKAGKQWGEARGYQVQSGNGANNARWGSW